MKDTYIGAKLLNPTTIRVCLFSPHIWEKLEAVLYVDGVNKGKLPLIKNTSLVSLSTFDYGLAKPLELGHEYWIFTDTFGEIPLDVTEATTFPGFDEKYFYDGNDLGVTLSAKETSFKVWAPLACHVYLKYRPLHGAAPFEIVEMEREDKGVYAVKIAKNLAGYEYLYIVNNSNRTVEVTDPYAKGSSANGKSSVVVDFSSIDIPLHEEALPIFEHQTDAIIYEAHVRDMTISSKTDIVHKGKFLGMVEPGRKTENGDKAGLDYLLSLGFNCIQILPMYDYKTIDETNPDSGYNWGYDPAQYFVPEGSYASEVNDPLSRIKDCKTMVSAFHQHGIRVIMDVVYNHVYESSCSVFERIVPNYFFRKMDSGKRSNFSGCGNDLATERPMVRKLIVDCCEWWTKTYGIDGLRFDLMGLIDIETLKLVEKRLKAIKPSFLLYGEGWNMCGDNPVPMGNMVNQAKFPGYGHFNDFYRESGKGFWTGDYAAMFRYKYSLVSSCIHFEGIRDPMFLTANQSINYVECHDNCTFFDFVSNKRKDLSLDAQLELVLATNAAIMVSLGVPFIHMGQEIGQSKWQLDNTYNKGDYYNKFSYKLLEKRKAMAEKLSEFIAFRKSTRFLHGSDPKLIIDAYEIGDLDGSIHVSTNHSPLILPYKHMDFFFNPTDHEVRYKLTYNGSCKLCTKEEGRVEGETVIVPSRSTMIVGE